MKINLPLVIEIEESRGRFTLFLCVRSLWTAMEEDDGVGRGVDRDGEDELPAARGEGCTVPRARIKALVNAISQYQDIYPVLQRGVQFLCQELCDVDNAHANDKEITRSIQSFVETGALTGTVQAMNTNLESPAFISSCVELLIALVNYAEELMTSVLRKTGKSALIIDDTWNYLTVNLWYHSWNPILLQ